MAFYEFTDVAICSMPETLEHRMIRSKAADPLAEDVLDIKDELDLELLPPGGSGAKTTAIKALLAEHQHKPRPRRSFACQATSLPSFLYCIGQKVTCNGRMQ